MNGLRRLAAAWWWATSIGWRATPRLQALRLMLALLSGTVPMLQPLLSGVLVDALAVRDGQRLMVAAAGMGLSLLLMLPTQYLSQVVDADIEDVVTRDLDTAVIGAGARMVDLGRLDRPAVHDAAERLDAHVGDLVRTSERTHKMVTQLTGTVALALTLATVAWWVPVALAPVVAFHLWAGAHVGGKRWEAAEAMARPAREAAYDLRILTEPSLAKEVRANGNQEWFAAHHADLARRGLAIVRRVRVRSAWLEIGAAVSYAVVAAVCIAETASSVHAGIRTPGALAIFVTGLIALTTRVAPMASLVGQVFGQTPMQADTKAFLSSAAPTVRLPPTPAPAAAPLRQGLEFHDVSFRYPQSDQSVLQGVDLAIPAGGVLALVGENGEGKSTLVKLLTRMYDPDNGSVTWDGQPIDTLDLASLRQQVATVFQDFARYSMSMLDNLAAGDPRWLTGEYGEAEREARILQAARAGGASPVIEQVGGLNAQLTRRFGGVDLSGGQWQRVATSRAFLPDASLLILDEPTSSLVPTPNAACSTLSPP